jgi:hypothetical protein
MWDTTGYLLLEIRRRAFLPVSEKAWTDERLLAAATAAAQGLVAAYLKRMREDFFVRDLQVQTVAGQQGYRLPARALGGGARDVSITVAGGDPRPLNRISISQRCRRADNLGQPKDFWLEAGELHLSPTPAGAYTLALPYEMRPASLVATAAAGLIVSVTSTTITVAASPAAFVTGARYDVVRATSPFDHAMLEQVGTRAGNLYTFAAVPADVAPGDYLCLAEQAPVCQLPAEAHQIVAQYAAAEACTGEKQDRALARARQLEVDLAALFAPRTVGAPEILRPGPVEGEVAWTGCGRYAQDYW